MTTPKPKKTTPPHSDDLIDKIFSALTVGKLNRTMEVNYGSDSIKPELHNRIEVRDIRSGRKFVISIREIDTLV